MVVFGIAALCFSCEYWTHGAEGGTSFLKNILSLMTIPIHVPFKELDSDWLLRGRRSLPVYVYFIIFCNKLRWVELVLFGGDPINAVCVLMRCIVIQPCSIWTYP